MKKSQIKVGGHYKANVSGKRVTVRVDAIRETTKFGGTGYDGRSKMQDTIVYDVTNLSTKRTTTFRTAARFLEEVKAAEGKPLLVSKSAPSEDSSNGEVLLGTPEPCVLGTKRIDVEEDEQGSDPSTSVAPSAAPSTPVAISENSVFKNTYQRGEETMEEAASRVSNRLSSLLAHRHQPQPQDTASHLIVRARAGTGKTTTLIEGLKLLKGIPSRLTPSPQQQAVWDAICLSKDTAKTVCFVAFNKSIATELQARVPQGVDAMTMHSMGFRAVTKQFGRLDVNSYVVQDIIAELLEMDIRDVRKRKPVTLKATEELVSKCKMNLVDPCVTHGASSHDITYRDQDLEQLASYYDIDLNGSKAEVFSLVPRVLERCKEPRGKICFDDMIWLPVVLNLPVFRYDLLLCDEAQDLNRCQQTLAKKAGKRLVFCGDDRQAIYGFAGADSESLDRLKEELCDSERGCDTVPLTVTRRCGKAIVQRARQFVPDFEAHESCPEGKIERAAYSEKSDEYGSVVNKNQLYHDLVNDGDMVLCRCNAPLVSQCFKFIRMGRKANIQGRDIGAGLISTVKKLSGEDYKGVPVTSLIEKLTDWLSRETAKETVKRNPSENKLNALQDRFDCLMCFTEQVQTVGDVVTKIEQVFTDDKTSPGIRFSSIHRAKGLESSRVFVLQPKDVGPREDKMQAWELGQERNLKYVAITRAIHELVFVS